MILITAQLAAVAEVETCHRTLDTHGTVVFEAVAAGSRRVDREIERLGSRRIVIPLFERAGQHLRGDGGIGHQHRAGSPDRRVLIVGFLVGFRHLANLVDPRRIAESEAALTVVRGSETRQQIVGIVADDEDVDPLIGERIVVIISGQRGLREFGGRPDRSLRHFETGIYRAGSDVAVVAGTGQHDEHAIDRVLMILADLGLTVACRRTVFGIDGSASRTLARSRQ